MHSNNWLSQSIEFTNSLRAPGDECVYRLHTDADPSLFASLFALFILHLTGDTKNWKPKQTSSWADYILGFQDQASGLFIDPQIASRYTDANHSIEHVINQLTGFCLSALRLLNIEPRYRLSYIEKWFDQEFTKTWLSNQDWSHPSNSGNKAMFVGLMLVEESKRGNKHADVGLENWFRWHDSNTDPRTGFWGKGLNARYWEGMEGFVHQLMVYGYCNQRTASLYKAAARTLRLQQSDGLFSPKLGGGSCEDYDAIHILAEAHRQFSKLRPDIEKTFKAAQHAILANQNPDGGFCWSHRAQFKLRNWVTIVRDNFYVTDPCQLPVSVRSALAGQLKLKNMIETGWSNVGRRWDQSSLWDTWFRLLALAEIEIVLKKKPFSTTWQPIPAPNFGWFRANS